MTSPFEGKKIGDCLIKEKIAEGGGGGLVFLGDHPKHGEVVLKILERESQAEDEQARLRFEREIEMSVDLTHENIVQVYQADADDEYYYLMMEYIDGPDIDLAMEEKGVLHYQESSDIIRQIAHALQYAHAKNIIHRDIKPSNILLTRSNKAKLCDFGLAKDLNVDSNLTMTGMVFGTPNFMSPEQWQGAKDLTPQSDIYSLGATFYYMITGKKVFEGETAAEVMTNSLFGTPVPAKEFVQDLPPYLEKAFDKFLARELEERFKNAEEVIGALSEPAKEKKGLFGRLFK